MNRPALKMQPQALRVTVRTGGGAPDDFVLDGISGEYRVGRGTHTSGSGQPVYIDDLGEHIYVDDQYISRNHCRIFWEPSDGWLIEDLQSANGTRVNGRPLLGSVEVLDGLTLQMGTTVLTLRPIGPDEGAELPLAGDLPESAARPEIPDDDTALLESSFAALHPDVAGQAVNRADSHFGTETSDVTMTAGVSDMTVTGFDDEPVPVRGRANTGPETMATSVEDLPPGLGRRMVEAGLVSCDEAERLIQSARDHGTTLLRALAETREARFLDGIYRWLAQSHGLEYFDQEDALFERVLQPDWLTQEQAERLDIVGLQGGSDEVFEFATVDPFDLVRDDWLAQHHQGAHQAVLAHPAVMHAVLERLRGQAMAGGEELGISIDFSPEQEVQVREHVEAIDVPSMVNYFLHRASVQGASDIHVEPTADLLVIRMRVDGILYEDLSLPMAYQREIISRLKILSGMNVAERRRPQDGRISAVIRGKPIDVRVSTYPTVHGEKVVLRLLDKSGLRPSPEHLGLLDRDLRLVKKKIQTPYGLIMVSGPTGAGKTTTLYSCLGSIDKARRNVLTVEDPVEYQVPGVHQMQVNAKIGLTFASGLRTMLRQDPDVIMVGECRDVETAQMAIQAALTGHVVFSTIHTNDAVGVVTRLLDMGIEPFLVASALSVTIAQRLVRKICPHCKTSVLGEQIIDQLNKDGISRDRLVKLGVDIDPELDYAEGRGCPHCRGTGYMGRRAVFEAFEVSREVRSLITSSSFTETDLRRLAEQTGMSTLIKHGLKLVDDQVTTFSEVIRVLGETQ